MRFFWLAVLFLMLMGWVAWVVERPDTCVSSMTVELGQEPVVNPVTCSG